MRRIITTIIIAIAGIITFASCDFDHPVSFSKLPVEAQQFIGKYFSGDEVIRVEQELEILGIEYDVLLKSGTDLKFNKAGEWMSIDCNRFEIPQGIIPSQIDNYIKKNYQNAFVVKIEKDILGYEVSLSSYLELLFSYDGEFIRVDHD